jgi:hypothetical protein
LSQIDLGRQAPQNARDDFGRARRLSERRDFSYASAVMSKRDGIAAQLFGAATLAALALTGCVLGVTPPTTHEQAKDGPPPNREAPTAATLLAKGSIAARPVEEPVGNPPTSGAVWVPGYWHWSGARYEWVVGHWAAKPGGWVDAQPDAKRAVLR